MTSSIYNDKFSYGMANDEVHCGKVIAKEQCPALKVERAALREDALHPLFALARCIQCRKEIAAATKTR